mgnify:CR=1 FL=1
MPWHIENNNPACLGFAVVEDEDGEVYGCHKTEQQAEAQLAALYASEDYDDDDDNEGIDDDDENLANEIGMRAATPNLNAAREMLAQLRNS